MYGSRLVKKPLTEERLKQNLMYLGISGVCALLPRGGIVRNKANNAQALECGGATLVEKAIRPLGSRES